MRISVMLILISALMLASGAEGEGLEKLGITRKNGLFFLLCALALGSFSVSVTYEAEVSPACLSIAVWLFGFSFTGKSRARALLSLPVSLIIGIITSPLLAIDGEWTAYLCGVCAVPSLLFGPFCGISTAALAPAWAELCRYSYVTAGGGFAVLELTEKAISAQLAGVLISISVHLLLTKRLSYVRTKRLVRPYEAFD